MLYTLNGRTAVTSSVGQLTEAGSKVTVKFTASPSGKVLILSLTSTKNPDPCNAFLFTDMLTGK